MSSSASKLKILTIIGARPQFIKAAALSKTFATIPEIEEMIVHTGQHFDPEMSEIFFTELKIPRPAYNLNINSGTHGQMTGKMLEEIEGVINKEKPAAVLVYGDTNSTLAGALAAAKLHVPVCHVEAGLRSFNKRMPEEINRVLTDHLSTLLFCPTKTAINNLKQENITKGVHHVGDVMNDIVLQIAPIAKRESTILTRLKCQNEKFALATIHRAESTESKEKLQEIINYLNKEAHQLDLKMILPLHPRTRQYIKKNNITLGDIFICEPVGYLDMQCLLQSASFVYTDSGGLQKEAYFHQVPCVTLRDETEWVETIEAGWNRLWSSTDYVQPRQAITEYGNGKASLHIAQILLDSFVTSS